MVGDGLNQIISNAEAALRRAIHLLKPEQRGHLLSQAETAFLELSQQVEEMRQQGQRDERLILALAQGLAKYGNRTVDEVLEEYR